MSYYSLHTLNRPFLSKLRLLRLDRLRADGTLGEVRGRCLQANRADHVRARHQPRGAEEHALAQVARVHHEAALPRVQRRRQLALSEEEGVVKKEGVRRHSAYWWSAVGAGRGMCGVLPAA